MNVKIRPMSAFDSVDCTHVDKASAVCIPWSPKRFEAVIRPADTSGSVAIVCGEIAGYAIHQFDAKGSARILRICVDPWHRNLRIGMALVNRVRVKCGLLATHEGLDPDVKLLVRETDDELIRFCRKCEGIASLVRTPFDGEDIDGYEFAFSPITAAKTTEAA